MKRLYVLVGPTGVGKTDLSLKLAQRLGCSIVNADSRQIYRDIPIGTAAPSAEQQARVPHFFVGTLSLESRYSAAQYEADALQVLQTLFDTHDSALLTGGSMLYIDAVCSGIDEMPAIEEDVRLMLRSRLEREGLERMAEELRLLDPAYYARCDHRNPMRVIHALEVCYQTGHPFSSFHTRSARKRPFKIIKIGLRRERTDLYERINKRTEQMMEHGLIEEARHVFPHRSLDALNAVGYKELFAYFDGMLTLPEAIDKIKRNTRVYAKKQIAWFKRDSSIHWFQADASKEVLKFVNQAEGNEILH